MTAAPRYTQLTTDKGLVRISRHYRSQNIGERKNATEYLEEDVLQYMQTYCAKYGLYVWSPNVSESPYSIYNSACRLVAITTFKHALSMDTYAFIGVDTTAATDDMEVITRIYDHVIHHLQPRLCDRENRDPGNVQKSAGLNTMYQRRNSVNCVRLKDTLQLFTDYSTAHL